MIVRVTPPIKVDLVGDLANNEAVKEQWKKVPYTTAVVSEAKKAMTLFKSSPELSRPSLLADLPIEIAKKSLTVRMIDSAYVEALEEYRKGFIMATAADFQLSILPRATASDFFIAMATGAARFAAKTPNIPLIKQLVGPLLAMLGLFYGIIAEKSITQERVDEERSVNRTNWFAKVLVKEELRIKQAVNMIIQRVKVLKRDIEDMDDYLVDEDLVNELKMLNIFMSYISPETQLKVNDISVLEFLNIRKIEI